jgi:hypothetical protein
MAKRWPLLLGALLVTAVNGCSKTQDTAPEQRIFGSPPVINSVSMTSDRNVAHCDITNVVLGKLCNGGIPISDIAFSSPTIEVDVGYHQLFFNVGVTDPESTDAASDILLVTVSYQTPPDTGAVEEHSLILLDDGSAMGFPFSSGGNPEACNISQPNNICQCFAAEYTLNSNDVAPSDDIFTRGFGWVGVGGNVPDSVEGQALVNNCLARDKHQAPASTDKVLNRTITFKVEATDREGNITEWPARPEATIGPPDFACIGDACACCLMTSSNPFGGPPEVGGCKGLPGIIATGPNAGWAIGAGLCQALIP